ncbi:PREDICTED: protein jagged-1-like, partial [Amphimedon queenslandica]|uniref:EGF-like domain-containing protein n=1 Tax=Amphimedon queenslandica TaxID=400682 RepID=A0AAN0JYL3_AMPQE
MKYFIFLAVLSLLHLLIAAQECPLPSITQIESALPPLLVVSDGNQVYSPNVTEGSVQYVCQAQGSMIDTYQAIALIATFTPNPGEAEQTRIFDIECISGTWSGRTGSLDPPPASVVSAPTRTDCYRCREGFGGDTRCRGCIEGYTGSDCLTNIDDCDPNPCDNQNAYCIDEVASYTCVCLDGYTG